MINTRKMRTIICIIIAVFYGNNNVNAKIVTTDKIEIIEKEFAASDHNTLVAFDCDEVLISTTDDILSPINSNMLDKIIYKYRKSLDSKESYFHLRSIVLRDMKMRLLDNKWPLLISVLQFRGIKTILLTACVTGKFGVIHSMEQWRRDQLLPFGIDFKKSLSELQSTRFTEFRSGIRSSGGIPSFSDGMLFSGDASKGDTLKAFLSKVKNIKFNKIVFLDDKIENLKSVEEMCKSLGIEFVGIEYIRYKTIANDQLDMQKVEKQFETLIKEKKWLSCNEIEEMSI